MARMMAKHHRGQNGNYKISKTNMSFLPEEHKEPKSKSNYTMPLDEGQHKFRVISSAVVGFEGWREEDGKKSPVRYHVGEQPETGPDGRGVKYFWAFVVWNFNLEQFQIMEVTQKTIRTAIEALVNDPEWGDPKGYNITITRKGTKLDDTEYTVMPNPHSEMPAELLEAYEKANIDLEKLFTGEDPFGEKKDNF